MDDHAYAPVAVPTPNASVLCVSREALLARVRRLESLESWAPLLALLGVIVTVVAWWLGVD